MEDDDRPTMARDAAHVPFGGDEEPTMRDTRLGPGTDVGGYLIDEEIGKGGMGHVYSATHGVIGKRAAVKVLRPEVSRNPMTIERFILEARAVIQIGHPNIIDIFAFGTLPDGRAYHIMDLLIGESLRKRLKRGALHPSEAASVLEQTTAALIAAHDKGFVHRDLKPDNIFLIERERGWPEVKLLDFGLAKLMPEHGVSPFQTKTGMMLGTPEYMSPEQARGDGVDYRTDVYALGIMTYEIIAGERPFPSMGDPIATLMQHAEEQPPSLGSVVAGLPEELVQLVDAMMSKEPAARPSLAAVRTVVKRLRETKLPTRTLAGRDAASLSQPSMEISIKAGSVVGLSLSSLEQQAAAKADSTGFDAHEGPTRRQKPSNMPAVSAAGTNQLPRVSHQTPPTANALVRPDPRLTPPGMAATSATFGASPVTPIAPGPSSAGMPTSMPAQSSQGSMPAMGGLAAQHSNPAMNATTLGVPPPPVQLAPRTLTASTSVPKPAASGSGKIWLILALLLVAGGAAALVLVLVNQ